MHPSWAPAFLAGLLLAVAGIPILRRVALATNFVDRPGDHKSHVAPVPYLGGVGLIGGVLAGMLLSTHVGVDGLLVALGAAVLGTVGLVDDRRTVDPGIRLALELGMALLAVAEGVRVFATGVTAIDVGITLVWIVGVTNAFNLLDNMDGLAGGIAASVAVAVFFLAVLAGQRSTARVAIALVGACLGFLVYNRRPASIYMGDAGSLFLGFALAILTIEVDPNLSPPASFAVPLILLALPVLDTATVTLARLRRHRRVSIGGRDHLSHRLVARGLSPGGAVGVLVAVEVALAVLSALAGRRILPLWLIALAAAALLVALAAFTARAEVYPESPIGWPRWFSPVVLATSGGLILVAAPAILALVRAERPARAGVAMATQALSSLDQGQDARARTEFQQARVALGRADSRLRSSLTSLGLALPGLSGNLQASRALVATADQLTAAGARLASLSDVSRIRVSDGGVPIDELERLGPSLDDAARALRTSRDRLVQVNQPYLLPPLQRAVDQLRNRLIKNTELAQRAADAARLLPAILGGDSPRRYFVAFQNNTELRATGGLIGNWGELTANGGRLRLTRFGRLRELNDGGIHPRVLHMPAEFVDHYRGFDVSDSWQQVNVSPDFPTTARVITDLYPQSGGEPIDGVIAIDPPGLASLLALTGPVTAPGWPEPVTASNVVDITLRSAYERFPVQDERVTFLGDLSRAVFEAFTAADLGSPATVLRGLARATTTGHLLLYLNRPAEEDLVGQLGADGAIPPLKGDGLLVVDQNLSANKVDLYLHRRLTYDVALDPSRQPAALTGRIDLTLDNRAPSKGLPSAVIGPYDSRFAPGENRTYLSLYSPFIARSPTIDGLPAQFDVQPELGRLAASTTVSIPALQASTIRLDIGGRLELGPGGWYRLDLGHQPLITADEVAVSVSVPKGWRIVETRGLTSKGSRRATVRLTLEGQRSLLVRVERTPWSDFWHRLVD